MHRNSAMIFEKYAPPFFKKGCSVLEIGADDNPSTYQRIVGEMPARWDSLDIAGPNEGSNYIHAAPTYITKSEYNFPIQSDQYDVVLSGNVIEHVRKIWRWMPELARVCKPAGIVITVVPVSWHYHEAPIDCWRIYPEGMMALSEDSGLEVVISEWESVELEAVSRFFVTAPHSSGRARLQRISGLLNMVSGKLKLPVQGAFDTITIARKPPSVK
jgi:SAM-dependent methyltransferase